MISSVASSTCRIELPPQRSLAALLVVLALLAAAALLLSGFGLLPAGFAWLLAIAATLAEWRRRPRRPVELVLQAPDSVRLYWPGEEPVEGRLRRQRRLGPLLLLEIETTHPIWLDCWLPGLPMNDARALSRQLARMRPATDASV